MSQFCPLFSDVDHSDESEKDTQTSTSCNSKKENFHSLEQAEIYLVKTVRECELHITKSFQFEKWDSICDTFDCELFFNTDNTDIRGSKLRVIFLNMLIAEQASSRRNRHLSYVLNEIMADMSVLLPFNFKFLRNPEAPSWSSVNIAGSSQIQHYKFDVDDEQVLVQLQRGVAIEETGLDLELLEILTAVYCQGVRVIYNLVPQYASTRSKDLLKWLWENQFANAEYIVEVDNISICIEDMMVPTLDTLEKICKHIKNNVLQERGILVHCNSGYGRTGTVLCAAYMAMTGETNVTRALEFIRSQYNVHAVETEVQVSLLEEWAAKVKSQESYNV